MSKKHYVRFFVDVEITDEIVKKAVDSPTFLHLESDVIEECTVKAFGIIESARRETCPYLPSYTYSVEEVQSQDKTTCMTIGRALLEMGHGNGRIEKRDVVEYFVPHAV